MDNGGPIKRWLEKPLCRRYAVVVFNAVAITVLDARGRSSHQIQWALGRLSSGEYESLGAWSHQDSSAVVSSTALADLRARGAEFISCGVGTELDRADVGFAAVFPHAQALASLEQALAITAASVPRRHRLGLADDLRAVAEVVGREASLEEQARLRRSGLGERYPKVVQLWGEALARFDAVAKLSAPMKVLVRSADRTAAEVSERLAREIQRHGPFDDPDAALDFVSGALLRAERRLDRACAAESACREASSLAYRGGESMSADAVGVPTLA